MPHAKGIIPKQLKPFCDMRSAMIGECQTATWRASKLQKHKGPKYQQAYTPHGKPVAGTYNGATYNVVRNTEKPKFWMVVKI